MGATIVLVGCIDVGITSPQTLFPVGTPFVLSGTAAIVDEGGPCLAWVGENGLTYHLFQDPGLENDLFDRITTPGVTSRLEIVTRTDLAVDCQVGETVEVQEVLEVVE